MRFLTWPIVAALLSISACATTPEPPTPSEVVNAIGQHFDGRPVQHIAAVYGLPDVQSLFEGQRVYSWQISTTKQWRQPVTSTTTGQVGDLSKGSWAEIPYRETTVSDQYVTENYHCRMDVYVREDGIVQNLGLFGKAGACMEFYRKLPR